MSHTDVIPLSELSFKDVLILNNAHAAETSWLDENKLRAMLSEAFCACGLAETGGILIAFDQDAAYDSPNFLWHRDRWPRFVYVDRIIIAPELRGRGYARALYQALFVHAARAGHDTVGCEVNIAPPNPISDAFHAALGFGEVGRARLADGRKTVRYLLRRLPNERADGDR